MPANFPICMLHTSLNQQWIRWLHTMSINCCRDKRHYLLHESTILWKHCVSAPVNECNSLRPCKCAYVNVSWNIPSTNIPLAIRSSPKRPYTGNHSVSNNENKWQLLILLLLPLLMLTGVILQRRHPCWWVNSNSLLMEIARLTLHLRFACVLMIVTQLR